MSEQTICQVCQEPITIQPSITFEIEIGYGTGRVVTMMAHSMCHLSLKRALRAPARAAG